MSEGSKPAYDAFVVTGEGDNTFWTRVGAAWPNEDGRGFSVTITPGISISGKIVLRKPRPRNPAA